MAEKTDKCAHAGCNCPAPSGSDYCSAHCSRNEDDLDTGCRCGHPECLAQTATPAVAGLQLKSS